MKNFPYDIVLMVLQVLIIGVIAYISLNLRKQRSELSEQIRTELDSTEDGLETKLTSTRQELDAKITSVGDKVNDSLLKQNQAFIEGINKMSDSLNKGLSDGRQEQDKKMTDAVAEINRRLESNVEVIQKANKSFSDRIEASTKVFAEVKQELGKIEEAQKKVRDVGLQVEELAHILRAPKARGGFGEAFLADFLAQWLPKEHYELQYSFEDGQKVDAIIRLQGGIVPIDAKFPLENFRRLVSGKEGEDIEKGAKVRFRNDVKKHIDDISRKYIRPTEGTFEFALMYVPAENVYYEMITADFEGDSPLRDYALSKSVIPVSPNSFFAYLTTVAVGLRGMAIEERTKEVIAKLSQLASEMSGVHDSYGQLGTHLRNATKKYTETAKKLDTFSSRLGSLTTGEEKPAIEDGTLSLEE